ncbi:hypothetical protein HT031_000248 [Scenedesmus sp. PABB004]|nr:hypothetical protein HT031_000248 [Scenedesmus sp. PABB004]
MATPAAGWSAPPPDGPAALARREQQQQAQQPARAAAGTGPARCAAGGAGSASCRVPGRVVAPFTERTPPAPPPAALPAPARTKRAPSKARPERRAVPTGQAGAAAAGARGSGGGRGPAARHAVAIVAAAEAAVSAAAAAMKAGGGASAASQGQAPPPVAAPQRREREHLLQQVCQQQARGSKSDRAHRGGAGAEPRELPTALQGHGVAQPPRQQPAPGGSSPRCSSDHLDACAAHSSSQAGAAAVRTAAVAAGQAAGCADPQQSAAAVLAAQGMQRRLRLQQRSLHGPPAFTRAAPPPRPASPPPLVLDGDLLLRSCAAATPDAVTAVDLSSRGITSCSCAASPAAAGSSDAPQLAQFCSLTHVDVSDNRLACVAALAWLPALEQLAASANQLSSLQGLARVLAVKEDEEEDEEEEGPELAQQQQGLERQGPGAAPPPPPPPPRCPGGFACLSVLDVSFNAVPALQLLGPGSPLAGLPRRAALAALHAAANGLCGLPPVLARGFDRLALLDLGANRLRGDALAPLGQLPALEWLVLDDNPLDQAPHGLAGFARLSRLELRGCPVAAAAALAPLRALPALALLRLAGTPLAARCGAGRGALSELERPGLRIELAELRPGRAARRAAERAPAAQRPPRVTVEEAATPGRVLAAAGRAAILGTQRGDLVAAFDRVGRGIAAWGGLPPVAEDGGAALAGSRAREAAAEGAAVAAAAAAEEEAGVIDATFITGVGITGELPGAVGGPAAAALQAEEELSDPTERLAVAFGLCVSQLAHHTHRAPTHSAAAVHRLRHALAHPLVDADAGQRPPQHHAALTAAAAAKQRTRALLPLPEPIGVGLASRVAPAQAMQGTLLQQLQAQAAQMATGAQAMQRSAAAVPAGGGAAAASAGCGNVGDR